MPKVMSASQRDQLGPSREHCVGCGEVAARATKSELAQVEQDKIDHTKANSEEALIAAAKASVDGDKAETPVAVKKMRGGTNDASS